MKVLVTGGAGYVGSALVPALLDDGHEVTVLDLYLYGEKALAEVRSHPLLREIKGDLRDLSTLDRALQEQEAVIHLACISNDPSYELNPKLGKSINYDAFGPLVEAAIEHRVERFIYASSSSVYGVKEETEVTEDLPLEPLTDYSKYKALCEKVLLEKAKGKMTSLIVRPATVCGYAPRLRLDLTVNILTNHAINNGKIRVFGGKQMRPNIHIKDMVQFYLNALDWPASKIDQRIYNVGYENHSVEEIANMVKGEVSSAEIAFESSDDHRSYRVTSSKVARELGFRPTHSLSEAIQDLKRAFEDGKVPNSMEDPSYYNIKTMQNIDLV